ncbi:MAG TPA: VanZ family protein [Gemmata sp.]|jgi:VanZ family protein|nr:VanZ family protein [Gemmata sp.]
MRTVAPFVIFLTFLGLWTWKLLEPVPVPEAIEQQIPVDLKFWLAKSLHAGAYAFLTVLAAFLPVRRPYFWVALGTLALHGVGTEIGQTYVPNRNGCVRDVIIDWLGIGLGLAGLWGCGFDRRAASKSATPSL